MKRKSKKRRKIVKPDKLQEVGVSRLRGMVLLVSRIFGCSFLLFLTVRVLSLLCFRGRILSALSFLFFFF